MIRPNDYIFTDGINDTEAREAARLLCDKYGRKYCMIPSRVVFKLLFITSDAATMPARSGFGTVFSKALKAAGFSLKDTVKGVGMAGKELKDE